MHLLLLLWCRLLLELLGGLGEQFFEAGFEHVDVVVDKVLFVEVVLADQTHQRQTPIHLPQIHHHILLIISILKLNNRRALVVKFTIAAGLFIAVDAGHVDQF